MRLHSHALCLSAACVCVAAAASHTHAADHLLAPSRAAIPLLKLFDLHRRQTDPAIAAQVVWVKPNQGTACPDGYVCVVCLANCPAGGTTIVQQLYLRPGPAPGSANVIDLSIFGHGP